MSHEGVNQSLLEGPLRQFIEGDPGLRLNRVASLLNSSTISHDPNTWVSSTRRSDGENSISIGTAALPLEVAERWGIGTSDQNEQMMVKLSHELAHAFQEEKGFEGALVSFLNGNNDINERHLPYIELYSLLSGIGPINGLTTEAVYAAQSTNTGLLKVEILEDITELIAAYIVSDEYFSYRLDNSVSSIEQEQKEQIAIKVIEVCRELH